jgi:hypothetical protein
VKLYRPVGLEELRLLYEAGMRAFPPRLPEQPIFYPMTNEAYARQIAETWNTKSGTLGGFVTRFEVNAEYVSRFERKVVGGREHEELWVPAEDLDEFNREIVGAVNVIAAHFGQGYVGLIPEAFGLKDKTAREQFVVLAWTLPYSRFDVSGELAANQVAIFLNFFFWERQDFTADGIPNEERDRLLDELRQMWAMNPEREIPLGVTP